jgi:hypothetical protein
LVIFACTLPIKPILLEMKKTILMFVAAGLMFAIPSCKKGENDPFLSFSSRKARVAGEWKLSAYDYSDRTDDANDNSFETVESTFTDGQIVTITTQTDDGGYATAESAAMQVDNFNYVFNKDGSWTSEINMTQVTEGTSTFLGVTTTTITTTTLLTRASGNWSFVGKVKDSYKNKERMLLNTLEEWESTKSSDYKTYDNGDEPTTNVSDTQTEDHTYSSGEITTTYEIDQLKSNQMVLKSNEANKIKFTSTPEGSGTSIITNSDEFVSKTTITLGIVK